MYNACPAARREMGAKGREYVIKNYNFKNFNEKWVNLMLEIHEDFNSWEDRQGYTNWRMVSI